MRTLLRSSRSFEKNYDAAVEATHEALAELYRENQLVELPKVTIRQVYLLDFLAETHALAYRHLFRTKLLEGTGWLVA